MTGLPLLAAAVALAGCAATTPADPDPGPVDPDPQALTAESCFVGGPWRLDLEDYTAQARDYLDSLAIPVSDLVMSGSQTVQFTADGLMSVVTDVTSTGIISTPNGPIPFEVRSTDGGSGDWSLGDDSIMTIDNWNTVAGQEPAEGAVDVPLPDYSTLSPVGVTCQPGLLSLTGDGPFVPLFRR
jgi:hypothetical protein